MKIIVSQILKVKNEPIKGQDGKDWTLKEALMTACFSHFQGDNPTGEEKYKRWKIAQKIDAAETEVELTVEEVGVVKKLCGHVYPTISVGAIWSVLEK